MLLDSFRMCAMILMLNVYICVRQTTQKALGVLGVCCCLLTCWTSNLASCMDVACSLLMHLFTIMFVLQVVCFIVLANCLLNTFIICPSIVDFYVFECYGIWLGLSLPSPFIVFHSVRVFWFSYLACYDQATTFEMLCLSACRIMLVRVVLAVLG